MPLRFGQEVQEVLWEAGVSAPGAAQPWYADGLRFECTRCGACCDGAPGHVWVSIPDCQRIAAALDLAPPQFTTRHVRRVGTRLSLLEEQNGDCEFLVHDQGGGTKCAIHQVRPVQCRTWPFGQSNLASRDAWRAAARGCPGINTGPRHALSVIQAALEANGDLPL